MSNFPTLYEHLADIPPEAGNMPLRALVIIMIGESGELNVMRQGITKEQFVSDLIPELIGTSTETSTLTRPQ